MNGHRRAFAARYRTRLTGLVTQYGRREGAPFVPVSNFTQVLLFETPRYADALTKQEQASKGVFAMLGWALTFLVIALIAAALGFGGIAGVAAGIAQIIFYVFLVLLLISLIMHFARGTAP